MIDERFLYVDMLKEILNKNEAFSVLKNDIKIKNKSFFNMLFMTTFRQLCFIKKEVLPCFIKKKIPSKQNILNYILYLGATELLFMDSAHYAVINSYVEVAKKKADKFGANFVNAVLRNILRQKDALLANRKTKIFSDNFIKILKKDYNTKEIEEMEFFANIEPMLDLSFKPEFKPSFENGYLLDFDTYRLPSNTKITELEGFNDGMFWAQDASSSLAVKVLDNIENKKVLDLCAAPGGKTAQLLSKGAIVTAVDISELRLGILKENIKRLKLEKNLNIVCADALEFNTDEVFDIILIDAPCSASGTFRRHPEIIHTKNIKDVDKMANLQEKILEKSINFLKKDGVIIYATCSLSKDEGERQILKFIKKYTNFNIIPINIYGTKNMLTKEGFLRILPQSLKNFSGTDGFFVACLQRKN